jgi:anaerobic magnesium-protoporphyrin IX monomethyl ester cyclase
MIDLLLIPAPSVYDDKVVPYVSCGLLSLQATAGRGGNILDILQLAPLSGRKFNDSDELASAIADLVDGDRYAVVGLSTMCSSLHHSLAAALELKRRFPKLRLWLGGPHVSVRPHAALARFPEIEAVFVGEAESTLAGVLRHRPGAGLPPLAGIPGVAVRESAFVARSPIVDLDALPFIDEAPDFLRSVQLSEYHRSELCLEATRGCSGRCSFCSTSRYWGRRVRRKSPARLLEEMARASSISGLTSVSLIGDDLAGSRPKLLEFCRLAADACPSEMKWDCSLTLSRLLPEDLDVLWAGKCRSLFVGLESASQETLDRIAKKIDLQRSLELIDAALAKGFRVHTSLIVGFPWETASDLKATYGLHVSLLRRGVMSQLSTLCPLPETPLERRYPINQAGGTSSAGFDGLRRGPKTREIIARCPELFTQLGRFETSNVEPKEVESIATVAAMAASHFSSRRQAAASA